MTEISFLRHGQSESNVKGILAGGSINWNLTQEGINQAKEFAKNNNIDYDAYYCSPLIRTHQTLEAIKPGQVFIIDERLREVNTGDWAGKLKKEVPQELYALYKNGRLDPPNGEPLKNVDARILSFLADVFDKYPNNEKIFVVCHNALMRNIRRLFFETVDDLFEPKNLETIIITKEMYNEYLEKHKKLL